jgi:formate hydrogenlyase subunit 6/NADH:ubiquinone oxidoreductase subunit I/flavodoxin
MGKYDLIAFGGPIWYYREPANLRLFIYGMPRMAGKLCVLFCTHGAQPDCFFYSIAHPLLKKAFTIIGWQNWYGGCQASGYPKPYFTDGHPDEIDIKDAEAFGRDMAERAVKIYAGDKKLVPEIPLGTDADVDDLWKPYALERVLAGRMTPVNRDSSRSGGGMLPGQDALEWMSIIFGEDGGGPREVITDFPEIDFTKCIYPRCMACADNCAANAIDLSMMTAPTASFSGSRLIVKEACIHCNFPLCQKACSYDAVIYKSHSTNRSIDMKKCIYPKCTLCADRCTMQCIDLTQNPPVIHNNCESCGLCWLICPTDAIVDKRLDVNSFKPEFSKDKPHPFVRDLAEAEVKGKFRRLVPVDKIGWDNFLIFHPAPRVVLNEEDYPYEVNKPEVK